jgi:capsular polysaccharide transport system permease protein
VLSDRGRIWLVLMLRDIRSRRGRSAESFLLSLAEPIGQLLVVYFVFSVLNRRPGYGDSLLLFLLTGVLPYFQFTHVVGRIMGAIRVALPMLPLGAVSVIDVAIAQFVLETLIVVGVGALLLVVFWMLGIDEAVPRDLPRIVLAVLATGLVAFGVGVFNASLVVFFVAYRLIWTLIARSLIFFSSVFFVVDALTPELRDILWWNPLLHGVTWFRTGIYGDYPADTLSVAYLVGFGLVALLLGLSMETLVRRRA